MTDSTGFLSGLSKQFLYYKLLGEKAMTQMPEEFLHWQYNQESNSVAIIVNHLSGNMMSRFTNFLDEDGEKSWRDRDGEFTKTEESKDSLLEKWNSGWSCLLKCLEELDEADLVREVYIRNMGHTVFEALLRQLAHYSYHIGQIVYVARMVVGDKWQSLSIPKGASQQYNQDKFSQSKQKRHFTDEFLKGG